MTKTLRYPAGYPARYLAGYPAGLSNWIILPDVRPDTQLDYLAGQTGQIAGHCFLLIFIDSGRVLGPKMAHAGAMLATKTPPEATPEPKRKIF